MAKILVVEDNEMNRDMLSRRLARRGYEVAIAVDGEQGVAMARPEAPALILMDMSLPGLDGWEATRRIKAAPETRAIPVIALTAHAMSGDREKAVAAGCDDFDTKPVDLARLLEELEAGDQPELAADLAALRTDARQLLTLLNEVLARGQTGPPDLAAARGTLAPPLDRVRAAGESLHRRAVAAGTGARLADLDRIRAATGRLDELLGGAARSAPSDPGPEPRGGAAADAPAPPRAVILVVDDGEDNRDMLARRLRRQGYEVQTAAGGRAALAALAGSPVDLVLLDVMMPDLDGYAVLERLKADPALRDIPVLMISALDELDSVVRCIQLGAEDYLGKPFDPVLLQARIGACLE